MSQAVKPVGVVCLSSIFVCVSLLLWQNLQVWLSGVQALSNEVFQHAQRRKTGSKRQESLIFLYHVCYVNLLEIHLPCIADTLGS